MARYTQYAIFEGTIKQLNIVLKSMGIELEYNIYSVKQIGLNKYEILYQDDSNVSE